ncbi:MAG: hypothetical protein PHC50_01055 [Candidatus Cloacimonetes bacterium]|nr:hypothetical protein [Candidatus Cloacimonadota bacterium]
MGTQQILLIIMSVIIIGVAITAGFAIVRHQSYSNNRGLLMAEVQDYLVQLSQTYRLVTTFNGVSRDLQGVSAEMMIDYIGWSSNPITNANGTFLIELEPGIPIIYVKATGKDPSNGKIAAIHGKIEFPEAKISVKVGNISQDASVADVDLLD